MASVIAPMPLTLQTVNRIRSLPISLIRQELSDVSIDTSGLDETAMRETYRDFLSKHQEELTHVDVDI